MSTIRTKLLQNKPFYKKNKEIKKYCDFVTCQLCILERSFVHAEGSFTFANTQNHRSAFIMAKSAHLGRDIKRYGSTV